MGGRRRFTLPVPVVALCILTLTASHLEADSAKIWAGHAKEFEELLENAEVLSIKEIGSGANNPKRVTLRQGERTLRGLWKPIQRGPKEWAWESYETEVAAYKIDRMLGLDMVPPTVVKEIDGQKGSLQLWVDGCRLYEDVEGDDHETVSWEQQISRMRVFDTVIGNWDRGQRNYMVDDEWNVVFDRSLPGFFELALPRRATGQTAAPIRSRANRKHEALGCGVLELPVRTTAAQTSSQRHHHPARRVGPIRGQSRREPW